MTREIIAYILLVALFIGALINIFWMDKTLGALKDDVMEAFSYAESGDFDKSQKMLEGACDKWLSLDAYTHVFIKHTEIDSTTDAFFDMLSDISEENTDAALGSCKKLCAHLDSLVSSEKLSFGSIF